MLLLLHNSCYYLIFYLLFYFFFVEIALELFIHCVMQVKDESEREREGMKFNNKEETALKLLNCNLYELKYHKKVSENPHLI